MADDQADPRLSEREREEVSERIKPRAAVVYEVVRAQGEDELTRSSSALAFSGVAAGMSISLSMICEGLLAAYLPDAGWKPLVENFGYCVGFLVVIMGRQQLFTENTITVVLPFLKAPTGHGLAQVLRVWGVVLAANVAGCILVAVFIVAAPVFSAETMHRFDVIAEHLMANDPTQMFVKGIVAGWLIATVVWMLPTADGSAQVWLIVALTWLIAVADLTHVVAGSVEVTLLWLRDGVGAGTALGGFFLPTLAGNIVGGTALFALLSYGQVHDEIG